MPPKMGKLVVADLKKRSKKGLEFAKQVLQSEKIEHPKLREALEHYIAYWDDFVHPGFFSIGCEAVGGHPDDAVPTQAAIAIMAAAFDVHDDIIDKSEIKHKVPTVYGKFGSEMALLLGNAFLIEGFKLFVNSMTTLPKKKATIALETMKKLLFEVGNAHALEIGMKAKEKFTANEYLKITKMKAASVEADMYLGALFGGGEDTEVKALSKIGRTLGILATLRDDLIDVFDIEELNQRIAANDLPLPLIFAIQDHDAEEKIKSILSKTKVTDNDIAELVDATLETKPVLDLKAQMQSLIAEGLNVTSKLKNVKLSQKLHLLLSFMLEGL